MVALLLALGGAGAPSIAQAAALANLRPAAPAPATDPSAPGKLLTAKVGTLHFPNWEAAGGWHAVGQRFDHIGNRTATTVYYTNGTSHVVYSIVSSPTLPGKQPRAVPQSVPAQTYTTLSRQGRTTIVWKESGHTCLLTGSRDMSANRALAARVLRLPQAVVTGHAPASPQAAVAIYMSSASASRCRAR